MSFMILWSRVSTSSALQARRMLFWDISNPEVATPPAFEAFPGAKSTPVSWSNSTASGVHGMLAPSATEMQLLFTNAFASSSSISF